MSDVNSNLDARTPYAPDRRESLLPFEWATIDRLRRVVFSFPVFLAALLTASVFAAVALNLKVAAHSSASQPAAAQSSIFEGDTWWHIAVGDRILATHRWPIADACSFTAHGQPWIASEWLGEILITGANRFARLTGLTILLIALSSLIILLTYYFSYLKSGNAKAAFTACALILPLAVVSFSVRPQLFGYVFLLIELILLERFRRGATKSLWTLPVIFLLWVNTHGTFMLGLAVFTFFVLCGYVNGRISGLVAGPWTKAQRRQLELVYLLSLVALVMTPYGSHLAFYPVEVGLFQPVNLQNIQEWQALSFGEFQGKWFLMLLIFFVGAQLARRLRWRADEIGLLLLAVYFACVHLRLLIFFAVIFAPILARLLAQWLPADSLEQGRPALNALLIAAILACFIEFFPPGQELQQVVAGAFPQGAVEYLKKHPVNGPMLNDDYWGGYLVREMGPNQRVFIDGRADLYEASGVLQDYLRIVHVSSDTSALLEAYHIQACLIPRASSLETYLKSTPDWRVALEAGPSSLLVRDPRPGRKQKEIATVPATNTLPERGRQDAVIRSRSSEPLYR